MKKTLTKRRKLSYGNQAQLEFFICFFPLAEQAWKLYENGDLMRLVTLSLDPDDHNREKAKRVRNISTLLPVYIGFKPIGGCSFATEQSQSNASSFRTDIHSCCIVGSEDASSFRGHHPHHMQLFQWHSFLQGEFDVKPSPPVVIMNTYNPL